MSDDAAAPADEARKDVYIRSQTLTGGVTRQHFSTSGPKTYIGTQTVMGTASLHQTFGGPKSKKPSKRRRIKAKKR